MPWASPFPAPVHPGPHARRHRGHQNTEGGGIALPEPVMTREDVLSAREVVAAYPVPRPLLAYAARLVLATHPRPEASAPVRKYVRYGASPRGDWR